MQGDVDMSPPANGIIFRLGLTHLTFDLDRCDLDLVLTHDLDQVDPIYNTSVMRYEF